MINRVLARRGLNFAVQDADAPRVPVSAQCGAPVKDPEPLLENETVPVGASGDLALVSVTVALHFAARRGLALAGEQLTTVRVGSFGPV